MTITIALIYMTAAALYLDETTVGADANEAEPMNYCVSADPALGDTAYWAITAVELFAAEKYSESIEVVDACFGLWGAAGGQQQKELHDSGAKCPAVGKVSSRDQRKIEANGIVNDVAFALWAKARSQHELGEIEAAKQTYAQCIYMTCGRAWDPKGWYWSPAEDCAKYGKKLLK